jgi:hypothetical protein
MITIFYHEYNITLPQHATSPSPRSLPQHAAYHNTQLHLPHSLENVQEGGVVVKARRLLLRERDSRPDCSDTSRAASAVVPEPKNVHPVAGGWRADLEPHCLPSRRGDISSEALNGWITRTVYVPDAGILARLAILSTHTYGVVGCGVSGLGVG